MPATASSNSRLLTPPTRRLALTDRQCLTASANSSLTGLLAAAWWIDGMCNPCEIKPCGAQPCLFFCPFFPFFFCCLAAVLVLVPPRAASRVPEPGRYLPQICGSNAGASDLLSSPPLQRSFIFLFFFFFLCLCSALSNQSLALCALLSLRSFSRRFSISALSSTLAPTPASYSVSNVYQR